MYNLSYFRLPVSALVPVAARLVYMHFIHRVFRSLASWGSSPAFVERAPGAPAVRMSAGNFLALCGRYEALFRAAGITDRTVVALFVANSIDFVAIFLSLLRMGAVASAIKLEYRKIELDAIFENLDPPFVICDADQLPVIEPYVAGRAVIVRTGGGELRQAGVSGTAPAGVGPRANATPIPDDVASINYTYRGYGYPLGAMVRYSGYETGAEVLQEGLGSAPRDVSLVVLPMPHIFTLVSSVFVPLLFGLTSVIARTMHPRHLLRYIAEERINYVTSVPEIYGLLARVAEGPEGFSSLKGLVSGGSLLTSEDHAAISERFGCEVLHGYGLTEFAPVSRHIAGSPRAGTIGPLARQLEHRIDQDGELLLRSGAIAGGYLGRPKESADAFRGGWFSTGDIVTADDGHLVFIRERKRTRKINGNMVDLAEVERALCAQRGVTRASVHLDGNGLEAEISFEKGTGTPGSSGSTDVMADIKKSLGGLIAPYKIPKILREAV